MSRRHSIRIRMLLWTVGVSGLILAAVIAWGYVNVRNRLEKEMIEKTKYLAAASADRIDATLNSIQGLVRGIALSLETQNLNMPFERVRTLQTSALLDNPDLYGMTVAILPSMKPSDWPDAAPLVFRNKDAFGYENLAEGGRTYIGEDWFALPRYLDRAVWSEPRLETTGVKMVSYSMPIHIPASDGLLFAGVVTCDIDLGWLDRTIANLPLGKGGYGLLMTRNGTYISHPMQELVFNESVFSIAEARGDASLRRTGQGMISGVSGLVDFVSFLRGEESWLAWQSLKSADWIMGTVTSKAELRAGILLLIRNEIFVGVSGLTLLLISVWLVARSITGPVRELGKAAQTLAAGNLDAVLPRPRGRDEIAELTGAFGSMRENLKRYIVDLAETTAARERMNGELRVAHDIQMDLLPKTFPAFPERPDMDLFAVIEPAREVGGDFYDFFMIDGDRIVLTIGDVSGKGVPAALFMAVTRSFLRSEFRDEPDPGKVLFRVNDELSEGNDSCMFVTLFCAVVRLSDGLVEFANAGHNPPACLRSGGIIEWIKSPRGQAAGAMPGAEYRTGNFRLDSGDAILLYTDGVTEAMDHASTLYGETRLAAWLEKSGAGSCQTSLGSLMDDIRNHAAGAEQSDDITVLMYRRLVAGVSGGSGTGATGTVCAADVTTTATAAATATDTDAAGTVSPGGTLSLEMTNEINSLYASLDRLDTHVALCDCSPGVASNVRLVLEELITNTIKYGYDDDGKHVIRITFSPGSPALLQIEDDGHPFDPVTDAPEPELSADARDRPVGGLGLHMVRTMTSSMVYSREGGINRLTLTIPDLSSQKSDTPISSVKADQC